MNQLSIISDLIKWIEKNLEQPLSIDHVATKSGYSKWHLQRMFKDVTGKILGTYIRHRRLTHAALALKLTSKPILDIAMQYQFDSQQTFTRSFKKQFKLTPANYRRAELWDPVGLTLPIQLDREPPHLPQPLFVTIPNRVFWGVSYKSRCNLDDMFSEQLNSREKFFIDYLNKYIKNNEHIPPRLFGFFQSIASKENPEEQEVIYTIGLDKEKDIEGINSFTHQAGLYACFKYVGPIDGFWDFIIHVYLAAMPSLGVKLRRGPHIEIYYHNNNLDLKRLQKPKQIECDYCIPIVNENYRFH
ncbi:MAG: MDR efflux pump AcrAB transcriptional activator RobA [Candidatus Schmidhempelia sp.]|nr:MDR efflux pump AcrAB transcriptional activator RobA [Candidatus Schmidhempelia sp.]